MSRQAAAAHGSNSSGLLTIAAATPRAGELSLAEVQRLTGISVPALQKAVRRGRLRAHTNERGWWRVSDEDFAGFVAGLEPCLYPGCDRPAVAESGCCSAAHTQGVAMRGKPRPPEVGEKVRATLPGRRERVWEAIRSFYDDPERSRANRLAKSERMRRSWQTGEGAAPARVMMMGGRTRSKMFGRWAGHAGGRPRGYADAQKETVLELRRRNPTFGRGTLAELSGLTEKQVRAILDHADATAGG